MFFIELKSGHRYEFNNYRDIIKILDMEIQDTKHDHYHDIKITLESVKETNVPIIKELKKEQG